jgi:hypothetical protein
VAKGKNGTIKGTKHKVSKRAAAHVEARKKKIANRGSDQFEGISNSEKSKLAQRHRKAASKK